MRWSYRIARVAGTDVKIHATFLLLLAWFGWVYWEQGGGPAAVEGISFILLLFLCVLLHEFGHATAARIYGIRTPDITILPIGGVARLERMPRNPLQELVVAVAGPLVNIVIAGILLVVVAARLSTSDFVEIDRAGGGILEKLLAVNVMLVVFNAIPAFPMDGGRILRALLAMKLDYVKATKIAARTGQVMACLFFAAGFFWSPMLVFIAVFVFMGAEQELAYARFREATLERTVRDMMLPQFATLPADMRCGDAVENVGHLAQPAFPVVGDAMHPVGLVSRATLQAASPSTPVILVAGPATSVPAEMPIAAFVAGYPSGEIVLVENPAGQVIGMIQNPGNLV